MSNKPISSSTQKSPGTARAASAPLRRRSTGSAKNPNMGITSESIASDLADFRKDGGRIEVLGNTAMRKRVTTSAFSSRGNTQRKAPTKPAARTGTKG